MFNLQKNNFFCSDFILFFCVLLFAPSGVYATGMEIQNVTIEASEPTNGTLSKLITDIRTIENNDSTSIVITCNTLLNYSSTKKTLPPGLVLYFPEISLGTSKTEYVIDNPVISTIKASNLVDKERSKITISLKKDLPYQISREENVVRVIFARETETGTAESIRPELPVGNKLINIIPETLENKFKIAVNTNHWIEDVKTFTLMNPPRIVLDLYGVKSGLKGQQTKKLADTRWVKNVRYFAYPEKLRLVLDTKTEFLTAYITESQANGLLVFVGYDIKTN